MPNLWTHSLETQRKACVESALRLLELETSLRCGELPLPLSELNALTLLILQLTLDLAAGRPWPYHLPSPQKLAIALMEWHEPALVQSELRSLRASLAERPGSLLGNNTGKVSPPPTPLSLER